MFLMIGACCNSYIVILYDGYEVLDWVIYVDWVIYDSCSIVLIG